MKKLLLLLTVTVFLGSAFFSIPIGGFQLYPLRMLLLTLIGILVFRCFIPGFRDVIWSSAKKNAYSVAFFFFWLCWSVLSVVWVQDDNAWLRAVIYLATAFLLVLLVSTYIRQEQDVFPLLRGVLMMSAFHSVIGWYEIITQDYLFSPRADFMRIYDLHVPVSIYGENEFAGLMFFTFFLSYGMFTHSKTKLNRLAYLLLMVNCVGLLIMGGSRAYQLAFLFGLAYLFFSMKRGKLTLLLCSVALVFAVPGVLEHLCTNLQFDFTPSDNNSTGIRINLLRNGLVFLGKTLGFGTGAGQIEYWMAYHAVYPTGGIIDIHNWWGELFVGYGFLIFFGYLVFYGKLFVDLRNKYRSNQDGLAQSFCCILAGFVVGSVSSSSNMSAEWTWLIFAIMIAYQGTHHPIQEKFTAIVSNNLKQ